MCIEVVASASPLTLHIVRAMAVALSSILCLFLVADASTQLRSAHLGVSFIRSLEFKQVLRVCNA